MTNQEQGLNPDVGRGYDSLNTGGNEWDGIGGQQAEDGRPETSEEQFGKIIEGLLGRVEAAERRADNAEQEAAEAARIAIEATERISRLERGQRGRDLATLDGLEAMNGVIRFVAPNDGSAAQAGREVNKLREPFDGGQYEGRAHGSPSVASVIENALRDK